jgi:hypothetical protein
VTCTLGAFACTVYGSDDQTNLPARDGGTSNALDAAGPPIGDGSSGSFNWQADGGAGDGSSEPTPPPTRSPGLIECESMQCSGGVPCCIGLNPAPTLSCGGACSIATIRCDEPADCSDGKKCCAPQGSSFTGTSCQANCGADYVLCVTDADCDPGKQCLPANAPVPAPYRYCK